jgi:hypothetical protein
LYAPIDIGGRARFIKGSSFGSFLAQDRLLSRESSNVSAKYEFSATKPMPFSNSLVESVNKLLKYRYLFPKQLANSAALTTHLAMSIQDYNDVRPHGSLNGLKPS